MFAADGAADQVTWLLHQLCGTSTHNYKSNGTIDLSPPPNVATGEVICETSKPCPLRTCCPFSISSIVGPLHCGSSRAASIPHEGCRPAAVRTSPTEAATRQSIQPAPHALDPQFARALNQAAVRPIPSSSETSGRHPNLCSIRRESSAEVR